MPSINMAPATMPGTRIRSHGKNNNCIATTASSEAKTPHRRRRKGPADHSSHPTMTENKENESSIPYDRISQTTMNEVTLLPRTSRMGTIPRRNNCNDGSPEDILLLEQASREMTRALTMTRQQHGQSLLNDSEFRSSILELSLRLPPRNGRNDTDHGDGADGCRKNTPSHPMRLLQQANHVHDHCNGLLKEAKRFLHPEPENQPPPKQHGLFLALHSVRAVVQMMMLLPEDRTDVRVSRQETCLKLLYHVISGGETTTTADAATATPGDIPHNASARPCWIVVGGVEALQWLLLQYNVCCDSGVVHFTMSESMILAVPSILEKDIACASNGRRMTLRQVLTIGFKAYLAAATAIQNLRHLSLSSMTTMEDEAVAYGTWARQWTMQGDAHEFLPLAYRPWLAFVLSSPDIDSLKDILGHAKAGHRLLWDMAANAKTSETALTIRQAAILTLLPSSSSTPPETKHSITMAKSHTQDLFQAACGYAWKAATVFSQQPHHGSFPVFPTSPLGKFHTEIGTQLDSIAPGLESDGDGIAFEEYCAYRALHCGIHPKLLLSLARASYQHEQPQRGTMSLGEVLGSRSGILLALLVAIEAQHRLFETDVGNILPHGWVVGNDDTTKVGTYNDHLTGTIGAMVQCECQCLTAPMQHRYFKLISAMSIHRTIFHALVNRETRPVNLQALEILSVILSQCLGPLMLLFANTVGNQDMPKRDSVLDAAMECYVRPLAAFEHLRESCPHEEGRLKFEEMANDLMSSMYQRFFRQQNPPLSVKLLEKCAKTVAMVGRQRSEQNPTAPNAGCLLPCLYAVSIFRYLSDHHVDDSSSNQYQLTARLAHLACALQSSELHYEAMVVHSYVLAQELPYCYAGIRETWMEIDFLEFLASRCKNALSPYSSKLSLTALGKSSIRRIIAAADALSNDQGMCSDMNSSMRLAWKTFMSSTGCFDFDEEDHDNQQRHFVLPVGRLFTKVLLTQKTLDEPSDEHRTRVALLLIDMMADVGASLDRSAVSWQADACRSICEILPTVHSRTGHGLVAAVIQVVASTCLMYPKTIDFSRPHPPDTCSETLPTVAHLDEALALLREDQKPNNEFHSELLAVAIRHLLWHVAGRGADDLDWGLFKRFQAVMDLYTHGSSVDADVGQFCRRSFLWALSHFQCYLESCRDPVRSIISMHWLMNLGKGGDEMETAWSQTAGIDIFLSNPLSSVQPSRFELPLATFKEEYAVGSPRWFALMELELASQRMRLAFGNAQQDATSILQTIQSFLLEAEEYNASQQGQRDAASKWLLCNLHYNLTGHYAAWGNFAEALAHSKEACRYCMAVVSLLRFGNVMVGEDINPVWAIISRSTLLPRAKQRYAELLCLRSRIYSRVGDHRKAVAYLATYSDFLGFKSDRIDTEAGLDIQVLLSAHSRLQESDFRRLNAEIRCSASSLDIVAKGLKKSGKSWLHEAWSESSDASHQIQVILDILSVGDLMYGESIHSLEVSFRSFYTEALNLFSDLTSANNLLCAFEKITGTNDTKLSAKIAIREIRCLLSLNREQPDDSLSYRILDLCTKVIDNTAADKDDRAWAMYYSADHMICDLRGSGSLQRLWNGDEDTLPEDDRKGLERARVLLATAISFHVIGSDILSRVLLRTLALVSGPEIGSISNASAGSLVLMSIGQSYRQQMIRSLTESESEPSGRIKQLLGIFDLFDGSGIDGDGITQLLEELAAVSPDNWKFVAVALSPSGDALITQIESDSGLGAMAMKTTWVEPRDSSSVYNDILVPLDEIVEASQKQLQGMDVSAASERFSKEEAKRTWWDNRHMLDEKILAVVERVESNYFPSLHLSSNTGESIFQSTIDSENLPIGNLASRFEAAVDMQTGEEETNESLRKLTVPTLKELLRDKFGFSDAVFRKMKKQDLIDLYLKESKLKAQSEITMIPTGGCLFLLLDENLHRFPFEGMPSLMGNSVCRVPSLSFVLATLLDRNGSDTSTSRVVDPSMASYVLDPEGNLVSSRNRIRPVLDRIVQEHHHSNWDWRAVVGEIPSASFFEDGLCRTNGLFMYFGHGGAQTCFSRKQVENLIAPRDSHHEARACQSTVILMGCSSGRLVSVNRKHSQCLDQQIPLYYEPEGIALSYLCAGAPCVVGNLWDVTDHDIDRFSTTLLETFLIPSDDDDGGPAMSLAGCVARARSVCKLRYMVGCAPVCYGVPVHVLR